MAEKANKSLTAEIFDLTGKSVSTMTLPAEIFGSETSSKLLAQAVRVYQANKRMGTHDTKTRSEVTGTTKKMYKQKGTGRARHGSGKDPVFVGGGIAHGPHPRDYSLAFPKKMRRVALFGALTNRFNNDEIKFVEGIESVKGKTKALVNGMMTLSVYSKKDKKRKALIVTSKNLSDITLAGRNIEGLTIKEANLLNALDVMTHKKIIMMKDAVESLTKTFTEPAKPSVSKEEEVSAKKTVNAVKKPVVKKAVKSTK